MAIGPPSDAALVRYLLGQAEREDEERFDQLSVIDAAFAERLRAIEHDLADAYVREELSPSDRERWKARYLASQHGRDDLALAEALAARDAEVGGRGSGVGIVVGRVLRPAAGWSFAAAAVLVLAIVGGYRLFHSGQPPVSVSQQLPAATPTPATAPPPPAVSVVALTLTPSLRSIDEPPTVRIPPGTTEVKLTLRLDGDEYKLYRIAVRDLTASAIVWNSSDTAAERAGETRSLVVTIPASTFQTRRYLINVSAGPSDAREIVATYPLVVVLQ